MTSLSTSEHGLPIDQSFATAASEEQLQRSAEALRAKGIAGEPTPGRITAVVRRETIGF